MFVPTAKAPPKAGAKELSYNSLNLAYSGQHPCFGPNKFIQFCRQRGDEYGMPRKACTERGKDTGHQILPGLTQGSFEKKELDRTTIKLLLKWMLIESGEGMLSSMRLHVTRLQFDSYAEKDSLCGTVMTHDGLNLRCLDQCHGVRCHGRSSYQSWRKRLVIRQSEFDPQVYNSLHHYIRVFQTSLRPAQGSFSVGRTSYVQQLKVIYKWMLIELWRRHAEFNVCANMWEDCSCQLCRER